MKNVVKISVIMMMAAILMSFIANVTITGKVTDENGQPVEGVKIAAKGSNAITYTDFDGNYEINVSDKTTTLVFSVNGYNTVEEKISNRKVINVAMHPVIVIVQEDRAEPEAKRFSKMYAAPSSESISFQSVASYPEFNTEGYAPVNENGFKNVRENPLSTFSIDVDNASYSNIRRYINGGQLPPADAVRIEEMINYFRYDYPEPKGEHPFSVYTEMSVCPWNTKHYLFHAGLKGKSIDKTSLPPSNLVFLIDVSGSMNYSNKLPLLKSAFRLLVNELRSDDHVAIVVYAGAAGLVLESTPGNRKEKIMAAIEKLEAGGSTAGGEGLRLAYNEARKNFIEGGNNRIILATDGDFNVGESSNGGMERLVEQNRSAGVFMTVLGFGMGNIKDDKMEIIADKGNGNYYYIDNQQEARKVLVSEFGGTLFTIAKDVKFQIEFNPSKIKAYRLIGYENRLLNAEDFNDDTKDAGEMGSGHNVTALYEIIPAGSNEEVPSVDPLKYQSQNNPRINTEESSSSEYLTIKLRYKKQDGNTSRLFEKPVSGRIRDIEESSENIRFAAAVIEFGMLLRDSEYKGNATLESAVMLAATARGEDLDGYRSEMIRLMKVAKDLKITADK